MLDKKGNLITSEGAIEALAVETYRKRLENREINENLKNLQKNKEELCKKRLKIASQRKTPDWTMDQLEVVLKYLKRNKSRDPMGYDLKHVIYHQSTNIKELEIILKIIGIYSECQY